MTVADLVAAITSAAEAEGSRVVGWPLSATGPVVDPVGAADPFAPVESAGVAFLLPDLSFLREPLAALLGDPAEVDANVETLRSSAKEMLAAAAEHRANMRGANDPELDRLGDELESLGLALFGIAAVTAVSGMLVNTLRGVLFDRVAALAAELTKSALLAKSAAPHTAGRSIAQFHAVAGRRAVTTARFMSDRITELLAALERQADRLKQLDAAMAQLTAGTPD